MDLEATRDRIAALLHQEEAHYKCQDYFYHKQQQQQNRQKASHHPDPVHIVAECAHLVTDPSATTSLSSLNVGATSSSSHKCTPPRQKSEQERSSPNLVVECNLQQTKQTSGNEREQAGQHQKQEILITSSSCSLKNVTNRMKKRRKTFCSWRKQIFDWACKVVEIFHMDREVVLMSFNVLDRFVAKEIAQYEANAKSGSDDWRLDVDDNDDDDEGIISKQIGRDDFQLYAMTCLYLTIKLMEPYPRKLGLAALVDMSRGFYTEEDIAETEIKIAMALKWHLHPPTASSFCREFFNCFPDSISTPVSMLDVRTRCAAVVEMAVSNSFFVGYKPSLLGLACVLHVLRLSNVPDEIMLTFVNNLQGLITTHNNADFQAVYLQLQKQCVR